MNAPFLIVAGVVIVAAFLLRRVFNKTTGAEGGSGTGAGGGSQVRVDLGNPVEGAGGGAVAGAAGGLAILPPFGALVGALVGATIGLITEIKPFGSAVRNGIEEWLRKTGDKASNPNEDAILMRWALLRIATVYRGPGGRVAIRVARVRDNPNAVGGKDVIFEGFNGVVSPSRVINKAAHDIAESLAYRQPADLDPPAARTRTTQAFKDYKRNARQGDLYEIIAAGPGGPLVSVFPAPPHVPAYTVRKRPRIAFETPIRDARDWTAVHTTEANVDSVAQWWDRAVGADWS